MNRKSLTLVEILVSVIILAVVFAGLTAVFISAQRYIQHSRSRMTGGELGKFFLDPLQIHVNQATWGTAGNLLTNPPAGYSDSKNILGRVYDAEYTIYPNALSSLTRVKVRVTLPSLD